jgi:SET domain-containing protein
MKNDDLVVVKHHLKKGKGLFARNNIKARHVIAYYVFEVFNENTFVDTTRTYCIEVYTKAGNVSRGKVGNISIATSNRPVFRGIGSMGHLANEPGENEVSNCALRSNTRTNFRYRQRVRVGHIHIYKLVATRDIAKGDEIMWCYGSNYDRDYLTCDMH